MVVPLILLLPLLILAVYSFCTVYQVLCRHFACGQKWIMTIMEQIFASPCSVFPIFMVTFAFCVLKVYYNHAFLKFPENQVTFSFLFFTKPGEKQQALWHCSLQRKVERLWIAEIIKLVHQWKYYHPVIECVTIVFIYTCPLNHDK